MGNTFYVLAACRAMPIVPGVLICSWPFMCSWPAAAGTAPPITVSASVPKEINPPGGAPSATPDQAAAFAWQEFIALNWPAGPQQGRQGQRDAPSTACRFGDVGDACNLLVWETLRGKVEIFPGDGNPPPGYSGSNAASSWGYDALPAYDYGTSVAACDSAQASDPTPWVNLDETDQITLDTMYAGTVPADASPNNSAPKLIRFLAKANRSQYVYVAGNSTSAAPWWSAVPTQVVTNTKSYLQQYKRSPPPGSTDKVSLPNGTIEVKAGWRALKASEVKSGRFHTQTVRFYENDSSGSPCYRDATWGLVALHIIQKTPSAPYFIYATFEQADNILTAEGKPVEDPDGNLVPPNPATATFPQVCLVDPKPKSAGPVPDSPPSVDGSVILTSDPAKCTPLPKAGYCLAPGQRLYYRNTAFTGSNTQPSGGNICVNKRDNAIPDYVITANQQAHAAITQYLMSKGLKSAPWQTYKLVNVQYFPYDKIPNPNIPNGSLYQSKPPYTATNPAASSYYQANIVVETNRSLQLFAGGLSPNISTEWNQDGTPHKNLEYAGHLFNMGGCMGCHGSQGQNPAGQAGDFSVILARGSVLFPEVPAQPTAAGLAQVRRNRSLR